MKAALQIDTSVLDAAKNLTLASDAIKNAMRVDTSALALTKALAAQVDTAAAMKAAFQIDTSALDWAKTIAPQFDATRSMVAALQRAVPEFPKLEVSSGVREAMRSLSAMNIAPQLAAALEPPASVAALLRDMAAYGTSFAIPTALLEAQRAAAAIASSIRLADIAPERFDALRSTSLSEFFAPRFGPLRWVSLRRRLVAERRSERGQNQQSETRRPHRRRRWAQKRGDPSHVVRL